MHHLLYRQHTAASKRRVNMTISRTAPFMKDDQLRVAAKSSCTTDSSGSGKTGCDNNAEFIGIMTPSVVSHKRLELFSLCFPHSRTGATGFDPLQRLLAPAEFFHDRLDRRGPYERLWVVIPGGEKFRNGLLQIRHADEDSPADAFAG